MLEKKVFPIEKIHVPAKRAKTLDQEKVIGLAEDILVNGQTVPIRLRADGDHFVLLEGFHRLEAMRALGEDVIEGYLVGPRLH